MATVYSWGLCSSEHKPQGIPDAPKFRFIVGGDKVVRLYNDEDLHVLEKSSFYLEINSPIEIKSGIYEAFEIGGSEFLFAGPGKFPPAADEDDLKALAKAGAIRFI